MNGDAMSVSHIDVETENMDPMMAGWKVLQDALNLSASARVVCTNARGVI